AGHSVSTDAAPFSYGAGVELGRLHLDYAYRVSESTAGGGSGGGGGGGGGGSHRFGLRWTPWRSARGRGVAPGRPAWFAGWWSAGRGRSLARSCWAPPPAT